ncbi:hypothetical protein N7457_007262 [Penicillium paradoxum]|uniref:uncharacterized protein n=1 Tax=Penicillium paradoxum TaxID=176176 RepID=UPI002548C5F5|nr:uncharacterized protein N7457_007262 [Penicillium paradoxum]KAJ5779542.1 hypothetical protein N7457_007262 [Penicillium paradoxum]
MAKFLALPVELLTLITSQLDFESLKALRLTHQKLGDYADREFFRIVSLYDEKESCEAFKSIIPNPRLKHNVRKIYLNTVEQDYDYDEEGESVPPRKWRRLLPLLSELPNLESVVLRFDKNCIVDPQFADKPQTELYRVITMKWLFGALVSLQHPLEELAIRNLQNTAPPPAAIVEQMKQVLSTLASLRLNAVHEREEFDPTTAIHKDEPHQFFTHTLATYWLKPAMGSLRKLSLYSSLPWGFYPRVELEGVHFPNLTSLTLGNFTFFEDKQLDWITSHSTIQQLCLDDCPILFQITVEDSGHQLSLDPLTRSDRRSSTGPDMRPVMSYTEPNGRVVTWLRCDYPRRWYDYFVAFQERLPHLCHFGFGINEGWDGWDMPFEREMHIRPALKKTRYMIFYDGVECIPTDANVHRHMSVPDILHPPNCDDEDREALKALYKRIGQQVDYGKFQIGRYTVENLLETHQS